MLLSYTVDIDIIGMMCTCTYEWPIPKHTETMVRIIDTNVQSYKRTQTLLEWIKLLF